MSSIEDIGVVIHILRVIRGLSQGGLARVSEVRNSSISNYERSKAVPKFETIQKLAAGLGLPLSAVEEAQEFIRRMRSLAATGGAPDTGAVEELEARPRFALRDAADLQAEVEQVSTDAGRMASRMTRLILEMLAAGAYPEREEEGHEASPPDRD